MEYCVGCDNEAVATVEVSVGFDEVKTQTMCATCEEAYTTGVQHGHFRAYRMIQRDISEILNLEAPSYHIPEDPLLPG